VRWRCASACRSPATACAWCTARPTACPGLIVDRYGDTLSAQFLSAGTERWRDTLAELLLAATGCSRLYERSDSGVRGARRAGAAQRLAEGRRRHRRSPSANTPGS
jgi:23S rRNA G2069 N7-methylase RlmK/C1962 C5-methylase RlmI